MTKQRVHKTLQQLPATSHERLPILFDLNKHPLKVRNKIYDKFLILMQISQIFPI